MAKRKQFTFYWSFYDTLADLPPEQAQQGAWAIITYALTGELPDIELEPAAKAVVKMAIPTLDAARKKSKGAMNSQEKQKKQKEEKCLGAQQISVAPKQDGDRMAAGCQQDAVKEKEVEIEIENEIEVENELEIEIEKESLYTDGVCVSGDTDTDRFERFWSFYPNKLGKQKAWEAWQMVLPDLDQVMVALERWKRSRQWMQDGGRYIPKAENFLEEKYYEQPPKDAVPMGASGYLGKAELEAIERLMNGD